MGVLDTTMDHRSYSYLEARAATLTALEALESALDAAREGGGERAVTRHHARGKLLARERIELLVDRDSPLLELSPVAGWGTGGPIGAAVVTAIGVVEDQPCVIVADDPTVPAVAAGAAPGGGTARKVQRAQQVALENRLPLVSLVEAAGGPPPDAGQVAAGLARLAAAGVPTIGVFFGEPPPGAGCYDYAIALGGTGPPADYLAEDERDALRLARQCALRFPRSRPRTPCPAVPPRHDPEDLLAVPATEPREILARILDGSEFEEVQPYRDRGGPARCAGWGELHGHPVAVLAGPGSAAWDEEAQQAARFVRLAARAGTPLLLLQHGPAGPGEAALAGAVAGAGVPLVTVRVGGQGASPLPPLARFRFAWPHAGPARSGASQPAGPPPGAPAGPSVLHRSGQLDDDGVIDPRDTRTVLGFCLSVVGS